MKITCTRADEIRQRRAEYDKKLADAERQSEIDEKKYQNAMFAVTGPIKLRLEKKLRPFNLLNFRVNVDKDFGGTLRFYIDCNDSNKFDDNSALSWRWEAKLNQDGEVLKESSSWSGLKACTAEQMDSLKQTVACLDMLNSLDWKSILNVELPKYTDYRSNEDTAYDLRRNRPKFEAELEEAEIEEFVGTDTWVKCKLSGENYGRQDYWVRFKKETPSMYYVDVYSAWGRDKNIEDILRQYDNSGFSYTSRIRKSNVKLVKPVETIEM